MAEHYCRHPTCYETDESCTMYEEYSEKVDGSFIVCGKHADFSNDIEVVSVNDAPSAASKEILESLKAE